MSGRTAAEIMAELENITVPVELDDETKRTLIEAGELVAPLPEEPKEEAPATPKKVLVQLYDIHSNFITTGSGEQHSIMSGRVTAADLMQAGVDIPFLLRTGAISDAGIAYA